MADPLAANIWFGAEPAGGAVAKPPVPKAAWSLSTAVTRRLGSNDNTYLNRS
jgi:hypothetical protein